MFDSWLEAGGPLLWIIIFCGIIALITFIERSLHLHRARIHCSDLLMGIKNLLRRGSVEEALTVCEDTPGPVAKLVYTAIMHREAPGDTLRDELNNIGRCEISRMERRLSIISVITQIAPLLGLLGTVFGILETVLKMRNEAPLIESSLVAGGLFQALITTAAGLLVAIPCYCMFHLLVIKIDRIVIDMEQTASDVMTILSINRESADLIEEGAL